MGPKGQVGDMMLTAYECVSAFTLLLLTDPGSARYQDVTG